MPIVREIQRAGAKTLRDIAAALNARGIPTARGGRWHAMTVRNLLARAWHGAQAQPHTTTAEPTPTYAEWKAHAAALERHGRSPGWDGNWLSGELW
jgi:hypothetical protein